jgi:hypothetical protein
MFDVQCMHLILCSPTGNVSDDESCLRKATRFYRGGYQKTQIIGYCRLHAFIFNPPKKSIWDWEEVSREEVMVYEIMMS